MLGSNLSALLKQHHPSFDYCLHMVSPTCIAALVYVSKMRMRSVACLQITQKLAVTVVWLARAFFDRITGYDLENMNEKKWLRRILFLETVAGMQTQHQPACITFLYNIF